MSLLVLLTNDDGAAAPGLRALKEKLSVLGEVVVVAPAEERSGVSHGLTIHQPIRVDEWEPSFFALTGNPADCIIFALRRLLPRVPDLVISGINHGANLGDDVLYSGTVAGAREAALHSVPALAVSLVTRQPVPDFGPAAGYVVRLVQELYPRYFTRGMFFNVNVPEGEPSSHRFTRQGSKLIAGVIEEKLDPRGRPYYWIGPDESQWLMEIDTDYHAIRQGLVSVTPLQKDQTDYRTLRKHSLGDSDSQGEWAEEKRKLR